jgi:hypothetical protein
MKNEKQQRQTKQFAQLGEKCHFFLEWKKIANTEGIFNTNIKINFDCFFLKKHFKDMEFSIFFQNDFKVRMTIVFTPTEKAVICGTLLGDGHLNRRGPNSFRLKIEHGRNQREYCQWKRQQLRRLCQRNKDVSTVFRSNKPPSCLFYTDSNLAYRPIHEHFYTYRENSKGTLTYVKTITPELIAALPNDPMVLACFYMDDGSVRNDAYSGKFATQSFSELEHLLLQSYVFESFGVRLEIVRHSSTKEQYYFSIPAAEFSNFVDVVSPIIRQVPTMVYKLNDARRAGSKFL